MRLTTITAMALLVWPNWSQAGQIYGTLTVNGQPAQAGIALTVNCPNIGQFSASTENFGSYRLYVNGTGSCNLGVQYQNQVVAHDGSIYSYDNPTKYDFDLSTAQGGFSLNRR